MLFTTIFSFFASTTIISARVLNSGNMSSEACSRELETVMYTPENCGFSYLKSISKQLSMQLPLLFNTAQVQSVINTFAGTYNVYVALNNAVGGLAYSSANPINFDLHMTSSTTRAMALGEGFVSGSYVAPNFSKSINGASVTYNFISYKYLLWNLDGEMYTVSLYMNKANSPFFC